MLASKQPIPILESSAANQSLLMQPDAKRLAFKVALTYVIVAASWILFSDKLVKIFVADADERIGVSIFKGLAFVILTGFLLYQMVRRSFSRLEREAEQRREAEAAATGGELRFRNLFENMHESFAYCQMIFEEGQPKDFVYLAVNKMFYRVSGLSDVIGKRITELVPGIYERDREAFDIYGRVAVTGKPEKFERFNHTLQQWLAASVYCTQPGFFVVLMEVITERKVAAEMLQRKLALQEQLTSITQTVPGVIYSFLLRPDGSTCFPYSSPAIREQFGFDQETLALDGSLIFTRIHPEDVQRVQADIMESARTLKTWWGEFRFNHPVRGEIWVSARSEPKALPDGCILWHGFTMDATERKQKEVALKLSDSSLNFSSLASFWITSDARIVRVNPAACGLLGYSEAELLQLSVTELDIEFQTTNWSEHWQELRAKKCLMFETQHRCKDGRVIPVEVNLNWFEFNGREYNFAFSRDITERKLTQMVLQKNEVFKQGILDAMSAHIAVLDSRGVIQSVNSRWQKFALENSRIAGVPAQNTGVGVNYLDVCRQSHGDSSEGAMNVFEGIRAVLDGRMKVFTHEYRCDSADEVRWFLMNVTPMEMEGRFVVVSHSNITERKQAEEKFARLAIAVDQAAEAIVITGLDGIIQYVNPAFERVSGYTSAEAVGKKTGILKSGKQDDEFYRRLWDVLRMGETWRGHFINRSKDGKLFEEEATISPIRDAGGTITSYVAVKRDVTREAQLEAQCRQAQKMEAIGTLAGGIAHDFNNILAAMFGYGYLLQQDTRGNAAAQEGVAEILKATSRAKDLVQQILTFSRQREQKRQIIPLDTVVKEAIKFLRASLPSNIKIEILIAPDAPQVLADPTQIYQVTINLATNALHAMEGQPGMLDVKLDSFSPDKLFIEAHPEFQPAEYSRLTIADTGHGMDAVTLSRVFEPFFTTKPIGKGTGLGLAVVHGIVKSHDGAITVESEPGKGTTFCVYFPAQSNPATLPIDVAASPATGAGEKILLLDDESAVTESIKRFLTQLNYRVTTCNSARAAVALFQEDPMRFDLVITDLTMPEINGIEVGRQMHMLRADLPILLFSGYAPGIDRENLRAAGISKRLVKPVVMTELAREVHQLLTRPPAI